MLMIYTESKLRRVARNDYSASLIRRALNEKNYYAERDRNIGLRVPGITTNHVTLLR